jgi:hypothetical protein
MRMLLKQNKVNNGNGNGGGGRNQLKSSVRRVHNAMVLENPRNTNGGHCCTALEILDWRFLFAYVGVLLLF